MHRCFRSWLAAAVLAAALATVPVRASAESLAREAGFGVLTAAINLVYGPTKVIYALGGSLVAGAAWVCSGGDSAVVDPITTAALRGDYVVTREHLTRARTVEFIGRDPADRELRQVANY